VHLSSAVTEVVGNGTKVTGLRVKDRVSGEEKEYDVDGVFVQIGLTPNSAPFAGEVEINKRGEIVPDSTARTGVAGLYAAGDVTDVPYKQIIIAMGEGAKAALSAVDDRMRGITPS
ncbi:MAG: FAD-dependent oxidoreductase, partial [Paramuribaculum sp.]|nr:FAD-dependent oxidoreductase [Paramuribaculum sp.]